MINIKKNITGFVFIGDPHIWSHKPGRRLDTNYLQTILQKIIWISHYCNEHNLQAVFLGDLIHEANDNDLKMISQLVTTMQHFVLKPLVLVGNHDLTETQLTEGTVLHLLHSTGQIEVLMKNEPYGRFSVQNDFGQSTVLLGGTPYGNPIPHSLKKWCPFTEHHTHQELKKALQVDYTVWITHDDLAFDSSYPNSIELQPFVGVDIAVNGHMHKTQKPLKKGETSWYNPGNINRLTLDLMHQTPKIWVYYPGENSYEYGGDGLPVYKLHSVEIPHQKGETILSLEGKISIDPQYQLKPDVIPPVDQQYLSDFVQKIKQEEYIEKTDDGVFLHQQIQQEFLEKNPPEHIQHIILHLFNQSIKHQN